MTEQIEQYMRTLKQGDPTKNWRSVQYISIEQYLTELLKIELHEREVNRINRMVKTAGFRVIKTLDGFVWNSSIELPHDLTQEYMTGLSFLQAKENLIFMGSVGTGKTHLATAIALKACQEGRHVRFFTAAELANILPEKNTKGTLNSFLNALKKVELIVRACLISLCVQIYEHNFSENKENGCSNTAVLQARLTQLSGKFAIKMRAERY